MRTQIPPLHNNPFDSLLFSKGCNFNDFVGKVEWQSWWFVVKILSFKIERSFYAKYQRTRNLFLGLCICVKVLLESSNLCSLRIDNHCYQSMKSFYYKRSTLPNHRKHTMFSSCSSSPSNYYILHQL